MIDLDALNTIARRVTEGEYTLFLHMYRGSSGPEACTVSLEKGSTYSHFHLKVEGRGATPSEAFEVAIRQFPENPIDGIAKWDTLRLTAEDATYKEIDQ